MGLISELQAVSALKALRSGKPAYLSPAQIANLIFDLPKAKRNLSDDEYTTLCVCYLDVQSDRGKMRLNTIFDYCRIGIAIVKYFDAVAPCEKYWGTYSDEFSTEIEAIRAGEFDDL